MTHKVTILFYMVPLYSVPINAAACQLPNGHHQPPSIPKCYFNFFFSNDHLTSIISIMFY